MNARRTQPALAQDPATLLAVQELWFAYERARPVLCGVNLEVLAGQILMVMGLSGGGKTTLLKLMKGYLRPQRGQIALLGDPLRSAPRSERMDPRIAYIPQQLGLVRSLSVLENALSGVLAQTGTIRSLLKLFSKADVQRAYRILETLDIAHKARDPVYDLSGGERQRVAIARALLQRPRIILADEFVSHLDPVTTRKILRIMREIANEGVGLVVTTHELDIVTEHADRVLVLRDGKKVLDTPAWATSPAMLSTALQ